MPEDYVYTCQAHDRDPCPVCDGCGIEGHQPGVMVCLNCPAWFPGE